MKERKLAPVMAQMNSERAKDITVELTRAGQLPLPGGG
jgi:flagellar motility protein MotE (MotC chaperone)